MGNLEGKGSGIIDNRSELLDTLPTVAVTVEGLEPFWKGTYLVSTYSFRFNPNLSTKGPEGAFAKFVLDLDPEHMPNYIVFPDPKRPKFNVGTIRLRYDRDSTTQAVYYTGSNSSPNPVVEQVTGIKLYEEKRGVFFEVSYEEISTRYGRPFIMSQLLLLPGGRLNF